MGRRSKLTYIIYVFFISLLFVVTSLNIFLACSHNYRCVVVKLEGTVDSGYADLIERILSSPPNWMERLIIILNTNGGYLSATEKIVDNLISSIVPVTVYIPKGGRAFSAGAYIAIASNELIMASSAVIGSAEPRTMTGAKDPKVINAMEKWMEAIADERGRNTTAAKLMVTENLNLNGEEALKYGIADHLKESYESLLSMYNYTIFDVEEREKDVRASLISIITDPLIVGLLIDIAAILILVEILHPTYIGGIAAAASLLMALYGIGMIGVNALALMLLALGASAIILETKFGHGGLALSGAILTILGILFMYQREYFIWGGSFREILIGGAAVILAISGIFALYLHKIREILLRREKMHELSKLIGMEGIVKKKITPNSPGVVWVASDLWTAIADEEIEEGQKVKVKSIKGLTLKVEKVSD